MKDQTDICELIFKWVDDLEREDFDKVKAEVTSHLDQEGRLEKEYICLGKILMDISEYHLAMVEFDHVVTSSDEGIYINSALVFNGFCLRQIGDGYGEAGEWEIAKGHYQLALTQLDRGLTGKTPAEIGLCGAACKADVHNKLGEYGLALGTIMRLIGTPAIYSEATDEIKARIGWLVITARDGIDGRGKN